MPARVQIVVEASDATGGIFRALTSQMGAFGGIIEEVTAKNINWGNVAQQASQLVIDGLKESIKATTEYAREVRDLSLASGQSAEESSRMLQVLDDYQLSAEDAKTATRALTKEGLAPTIDTIAHLSGEFQKLTSAEERNAFVQKNLGRAGQEWLNLLDQGPAKIRAMNSAVSESLILTDENIRAAEEYRLALDSWGDAVEGVKVQLGTKLLPVMTQTMGEFQNTAGAIQIMSEKGMNWFQIVDHMAAMSDVYTDALAEAATTQTEFAEATDSAVQSTTQLEAAEKAAAEAAKAMSQENQSFLGTLGQTGEVLTTYRDGLAAANTELAAGSITTEEHSAKVQQLSADYKQASADIVMSIVEMKLAQDGWTDAELNAYLQIGKMQGKFTQDQINMAQGAVEMADRIVSGLDTMDGPMTHVGERAEDNADAFGEMTQAGGELGESLSKEVGAGAAAATSALNSIPKTINVDIYIKTHGRIPTNLGGSAGHEQNTNLDNSPLQGGYQQGGEVFAGVPVGVGEAGREVFMPQQNGRILGHAESLHALSLGGGGGSKYGPFYGPVTIQMSDDSATGFMGLR
jgi:hypothetical protein